MQRVAHNIKAASSVRTHARKAPAPDCVLSFRRRQRRAASRPERLPKCTQSHPQRTSSQAKAARGRTAVPKLATAYTGGRTTSARCNRACGRCDCQHAAAGALRKCALAQTQHTDETSPRPRSDARSDHVLLVRAGGRAGGRPSPIVHSTLGSTRPRGRQGGRAATGRMSPLVRAGPPASVATTTNAPDSRAQAAG